MREIVPLDVSGRSLYLDDIAKDEVCAIVVERRNLGAPATHKEVKDIRIKNKETSMRQGRVNLNNMCDCTA